MMTTVVLVCVAYVAGALSAGAFLLLWAAFAAAGDDPVGLEDVGQLHKLAMDCAEIAFVAKVKGNAEKAATYFVLAFMLENEAARQCDVEPTLTILKQSAFALGIETAGLTEIERERVLNTKAGRDAVYALATAMRVRKKIDSQG